MSDDFGVVPLGQHGGRRPGAGRPRKGSPPREKKITALKSRPSRGAYVVARLVRDAREGCREAAALLEGVRSGVITPYAAGCEMNYCRRREPNGRGSENAARARDWRLFRLLNPRPQKIAPDAASGVEGKAEDFSLACGPKSKAVTEALK
jgi:hypothetical protein